jgi:hypothetical protein
MVRYGALVVRYRALTDRYRVLTDRYRVLTDRYRVLVRRLLWRKFFQAKFPDASVCSLTAVS